MAAFHPSPWLIRNTNPLMKAGATLSAVRKDVRRQILAALPKGIVERDTVKARRRHRSIARILASIERRRVSRTSQPWPGIARSVTIALRSLHTGMAAGAADRSALTRELSDLVDYAIGAPGVALGRALRRHDPTILDPARYPELVQLSWQGLRAYLDNPVILSSLPGKSAVEQIMGAVVDGGFESVLDEHFRLRAQNLQGGAAGLANDLQSSLGLRAGSFNFHGIGGTPHKIPVRCHVAVPFGDAETEPVVKVEGGVVQAAPVRPDEVRRSFNTPFWPHVLATTSVGQEGLDFHPWCSHVVHWDLTSNPLDLEQREGRIQRYASLAIRRRLAAVLREEVLRDSTMADGSPWRCVQRHAERSVDASGLRPWWVLDGAEIDVMFSSAPLGGISRVSPSSAAAHDLSAGSWTAQSGRLHQRVVARRRCDPRTAATARSRSFGDGPSADVKDHPRSAGKWSRAGAGCWPFGLGRQMFVAAPAPEAIGAEAHSTPSLRASNQADPRV